MLKKGSPILACIIVAAIPFEAHPVVGPALSQWIHRLEHDVESNLRQSLGRDWVGFKIVQQKVGGALQLEPSVEAQRETFLRLHVRPSADGKAVTIDGQVLNQELAGIIRDSSAQFWDHIELKVRVSTQEYAVCDVSLANLYVKPIAQAGANLASQMRVGTLVRILEWNANKTFARIRQEDDGYISWARRQDLRLLDEKTWNAWRQQPKGFVNRNHTAGISLWFGTQLPIKVTRGESVELGLPSGRQVAVPKNKIWNPTDQVEVTPAQLAEWFMPKGSLATGPYLWGGTVGSRLDCSGFVQTVYRGLGKMLPRDADQQQHFTRPVARDIRQIHQLRSGDLVFFSGNRRYATHVGIYMGNNRVIHSSPAGPYSGVKISLLSGGSTYDRYLQGIYFGGGRVAQLGN